MPADLHYSTMVVDHVPSRSLTIGRFTQLSVQSDIMFMMKTLAQGRWGGVSIKCRLQNQGNDPLGLGIFPHPLPGHFRVSQSCCGTRLGTIVVR